MECGYQSSSHIRYIHAVVIHSNHWLAAGLEKLPVDQHNTSYHYDSRIQGIHLADVWI